MKKTTKKGFTLVELVVVIAIIAILAAVLIPTFSRLVKRANVSAQNQLIRNMNTALATDSADKKGAPHKTMTEALEAAAAFGYDVAKINNSKTDNTILWDSKNDVFCYMDADDGNKIKYIPDNPAKVEVEADEQYLYWIIASAPHNTFSTYLYNYESADLSKVRTGLDVGNEENITAITYVGNSTTAQNVVIRTNSYLTTLTVNAPSDIVRHYGKAGSVNVISTDTASYHENGNVPFLEVAGGHIVLEKNADVSAIHFTATKGEFKNTDEKTISLDLSNVAEDKMPRFSRDEVEIATEGTFVAKVTNEADEYIWLWGHGTQTEMVVASTEGAITTESGTLKDNITAGTEEGTIADQIANNAVVNEETGETEYVVKTTKDAAMAVIEVAQEEEIVENLEKTGNYVARIGATGYETLSEALLKSNSTIVLLKDVIITASEGESNVSGEYEYDQITGELTFTGTYGDHLTIDLNGHKLIGDANHPLNISHPENSANTESNIKLTITDSSENKTGNICGIQISYVDLTLDGVNISSSDWVIAIAQNGSINNVTVKNSSIRISGSTNFVRYNQNASVTVELESGSLTIGSGCTGFKTKVGSQYYNMTVNQLKGFTLTNNGNLSDKTGFTITLLTD